MYITNILSCLEYDIISSKIKKVVIENSESLPTGECAITGYTKVEGFLIFNVRNSEGNKGTVAFDYSTSMIVEIREDQVNIKRDNEVITFLK